MRYLLAILLCFLAPLTASAEGVSGGGASLDSWRASLNERLDRDIAQLSADAQAGPPAFASVGVERQDRAISQRATFLLRRTGLSPSWLPTIGHVLRDQGLPPDLVSIAAVESGFNPAALSPRGARGLWQLMPETARRFGLVVDVHRDDRLDPLRSTYAASQYLKALYRQFGDWPLVLAAYNTGEDRVQRLLDRLRASDFWTLSRRSALPNETRRYVPAVLARLGRPLASPDAGLDSPDASSGPRPPGSAPSGTSASFMPVVFAVTSGAPPTQ